MSSLIWPIALISALPLAVAFFWFGTSAPRPLPGRPASSSAIVTLIPGVTVEAAPNPGHGLVVTSLRSDSEAARAGIVVGDDLVAIDRRPLTNVRDLAGYLGRDPKSTIEIRVVHRDVARRVVLSRNRSGNHGS